jgi:hypothetical protein
LLELPTTDGGNPELGRYLTYRSSHENGESRRMRLSPLSYGAATRSVASPARPWDQTSTHAFGMKETSTHAFGMKDMGAMLSCSCRSLECSVSIKAMENCSVGS